MKKTLKILMAIILFAVVLTIATSVNAASTTTFADLAEAASETGVEDSKIASKGIVVTEITSTDDIEVKNNTVVTLDATAAVTVANKIRVMNNSTLTLKVINYTDKAVKLTGDITVEGGSTLKVEDENIACASIDAKANAKVDVKDTLKTTGEAKITSDYANVAVVSGVVYDYSKAATVTSTNPSYNTATSKLLVKEGNTEFEYYTMKSGELVLKVTDAGNEVVASAVKKDTAYAIKAIYKVDGYEVEVASDDLDVDSEYVTLGTDTVTVLKKAFDDNEVANLVATFEVTTGNATPIKYTAKLFKGTVSEDPDNKPENPDNKPEEPAKPAEDDKKGDLDDAAAVATGDHIIPATALLAVVVVANVVYFAKSKNN